VSSPHPSPHKSQSSDQEDDSTTPETSRLLGRTDSGSSSVKGGSTGTSGTEVNKASVIRPLEWPLMLSGIQGRRKEENDTDIYLTIFFVTQPNVTQPSKTRLYLYAKII